jgi:predicted DNA-binding protein
MEDLKTTGQVKGVNVRMPEEEWDKVAKAAEAECRSLSGHVRFLIRKDIEEREKSWSQ